MEVTAADMDEHHDHEQHYNNKAQGSDDHEEHHKKGHNKKGKGDGEDVGVNYSVKENRSKSQ